MFKLKSAAIPQGIEPGYLYLMARLISFIQSQSSPPLRLDEKSGADGFCAELKTTHAIHYNWLLSGSP
jgi:hypothetical protein